MEAIAIEPREEQVSGRDYLARARELVPMLRAAGDEIERRRELPPEIVEALTERGIFRMLLPKSIGGGELDPLTYTAVLEELGRGDGSTAWALGQNSGCSMSAPYLAPEIAREIFGGPRGILAWGPDVPGAGCGIAVEGGYRVTGQWGFATGSRHATWLGCHVSIFEPDGSARLNPNGRPFVRTMLFRKSEARIIDNWQVLGLRGTGSDSYALDDHFVPQPYTCSRDNEAERREPGPLYQFTSGMIYAMSFSHVSLGIARGTFDAFLEIARDKVPRGAKGTLRENNVIQSQVAQCEARLASARAYLRGTIGAMWQEAQNSGRISLDWHPQLRLASTWAIHQARDVVATLYHAAGATAIFENNPLERRMRDIHAGTQQGQGRPIHFETVGQILLGLPPEGRMFR
ncbi:MAG: acyl-CoA dehydrogenase family protein [Alphaproteobacteria bacterium]|nr:acyl-CoA dehydrogenase family protein [Alphaproteobacteria bacterium]MBV9863157.1 acyl-CoA dehydrogenase family protein [Alphaproteobacteria bacterium]